MNECFSKVSPSSRIGKVGQTPPTPPAQPQRVRRRTSEYFFTFVLSISFYLSLSNKMADIPKEPPPSYDAAAVEHGNHPVKPAAKLPLRIFPLDIPVLNQLKGKRVILASASPRRKQLLAQVKSFLNSSIDL